MFDLGKALAKKGEVESARLDAFWFRHRARTMRLVAAAARTGVPVDPAEFARAVAHRDDADLLTDLRGRLSDPMSDAEWTALVAQAAAEARRQLIAEHGDPFPHRLA